MNVYIPHLLQQHIGTRAHTLLAKASCTSPSLQEEKRVSNTLEFTPSVYKCWSFQQYRLIVFPSSLPPPPAKLLGSPPAFPSLIPLPQPITPAGIPGNWPVKPTEKQVDQRSRWMSFRALSPLLHIHPLILSQPPNRLPVVASPHSLSPFPED